MTHTPILDAIAHFGLRVAKIQSVQNSYSSTVRILRLDSGVVRILKIPYVKRKLMREVGALRALHGDLPVPDIVDTWIPADDQPGALLLSCLPGAVIEGPISIDLACQMGALLATMHTHRVGHYGDNEATEKSGAQNWWDLHHARLDLWKPHCISAMPPDLYNRALELYTTLASDLPEPDGPCWVHCDYRPGNIMAEDGKLTGLIDFESARGGSADLDFTKVSHYVWATNPETRPAFLAGYRTIRPVPEIERTLPLYQLHNALGGIAWCVRRTNTNDPFFHENMAVIRHMTERKGPNQW